MRKVSVFASLVLLGVGWASVVHVRDQAKTPSTSEKANLITSGPFRDGLYLGRLAAERGARAHIGAGRWTTPQDRAAFVAGYQRGYGENLALRGTLQTTRPE
jgi:hypothetical protein